MECVKYQLGDICKISSGQGAPQGEDKYTENGTPFIKAGNLHDLVNGVDEYGIQQVSDNIISSHRLKLYPAGSVVFAKSGASCLKGYVYVLHNNCCVVSHLAILTPKEEGVYNPQYLCYYLRYDKPNQLVSDLAYPAISLTELSKFSIVLPSSSKQNAIVSELDKIQAALDNKKEQLKKLDELIQSKFYEMFGDPVVNDKGWKVEKLGKMGTLKNGLNYSQNEEGCTIRILSVSDFKDRFKIEDVTQLSNISLSQMPSDEMLLKDGDIVFVRSNGNKKLVGRSLLVYPRNEPTSFSGFCIRFRNNSKLIDNTFLVTCLKTDSIREKLFGRGANISNLNQTMLQSLVIPCPPLSLQQTYTIYVEKVEQAKAIVDQEIAHLQELLNSRMDFYFRK